MKKKINNLEIFFLLLFLVLMPLGVEAVLV